MYALTVRLLVIEQMCYVHMYKCGYVNPDISHP